MASKRQLKETGLEDHTIAGDLTVTGNIINPGLSQDEVDIATLKVAGVALEDRVSTAEDDITTLEGRNIDTGKGLAGGGDLSADRTLTWAPAYSASVTYAAGDLVTYSGNIYACIQAGANQTPAFPSTSYWKWVWSLDVTVSTSSPSGTPADGAIWIKRES